METLVTMASKPFPALTHLVIRAEIGYPPHLPDDFLGGYAPRLQLINLRNVAFPALQTLLLSASHLVELQLHRMPIDGNVILPVAMATCLAQLPKLKILVLQYQSAFSPPDPTHPPPVTHTVLLALTDFKFTGTSKYLEDFVAQILCPQIDQIEISYRIRPAFQVAQLTKFFNRSISPIKHAKVCFDARGITLDLYRPTNCTAWDSHHPATTIISCKPIANAWYLFHTLNELSVLLLTVFDLKFVGRSWETDSIGDEYNPEWLHFLRQPSALQALYVPPPLAGKIGRALKSVKEVVVSEALPSLDLICLEDNASLIEEFIAVRQFSDRPLTVVGTEAEFDQRLGEKKRIPYTD